MKERDELSPEEMNKALFSSLVLSLANAAMQHLGKIVNPMVGKTEVNLEAAQSTIDMLDMLAAKTRGNLDAEEERLVKHLLGDLKLNYVDTINQAPATPAPESKSEPIVSANSAPPADDKAKYHKSYGA